MVKSGQDVLQSPRPTISSLWAEEGLKVSYHRQIPPPLSPACHSPPPSCSSVGWGSQAPGPGLFRVEEPSYYQFPGLTVPAPWGEK